MANLSRRMFIKRTGAVTLGSTLGLGMLAPVTRKLYAADTSTVYQVFGVRIDSKAPVYQTFQPYSTGELEIGMAIVCSTPVGVCGYYNTVQIYRAATYREFRDGVSYMGTAWANMYTTYICVGGVPTRHNTWGHESHIRAIQDYLGNPIGSIWMEPMSDVDYKENNMVCKAHVNGGWGPEIESGYLMFTASCCPLY